MANALLEYPREYINFKENKAYPLIAENANTDSPL